MVCRGGRGPAEKIAVGANNIFDPAGGWQAHAEWNHTCEKQLHALFREARPVLEAVRRLIEEYTGAQWIAMEGEPAGAIESRRAFSSYVMSDSATPVLPARAVRPARWT